MDLSGEYENVINDYNLEVVAKDGMIQTPLQRERSEAYTVNSISSSSSGSRASYITNNAKSNDTVVKKADKTEKTNLTLTRHTFFQNFFENARSSLYKSLNALH